MGMPFVPRRHAIHTAKLIGFYISGYVLNIQESDDCILAPVASSNPPPLFCSCFPLAKILDLLWAQFSPQDLSAIHRAFFTYHSDGERPATAGVAAGPAGPPIHPRCVPRRQGRRGGPQPHPRALWE